MRWTWPPVQRVVVYTCICCTVSTTTPLPNRRRSVARLIAAAAVLIFLPYVAAAQCNSHYDPGLSKLNWAWSVHRFYTICYDERYEDDVAIVKRWLDATLELGQQKYGIARPTRRGRYLHTTVFLPPVATQGTRRGEVINYCCYEDDGSGYHAEIHYLTPSAWGRLALGPLWIPVEDLHPSLVVHEMSNLMHYSLEPDSRLTSWIREGLAEYDGFFYSTAYNRTTAIDSLIRYVHQHD